MKPYFLFLLLTFLPCVAVAGGVDVKVNKDAVSVSPVDPQGLVTVSAPPGAVLGMQPIQITAQNKKANSAVAGTVMPDGGFLIQIQAAPKDSIKLVFIGADGKKKDLKVKVSKIPLVLPPQQMQQEIRTETVTVPRGEPAPESKQAPAPRSDSEIISGEKNLGDSGVIE
ncbi:MAG: hypothetical protein NTZ78_06985 [Candidatus Aureabacteria bacterium]|nr:hypothetical protein [Candidatus Auribacterota bacterium]